jgi:hypothetical protein
LVKTSGGGGFGGVAGKEVFACDAALLGKASKSSGISPKKMKTKFEGGNFYLQWIPFATRSNAVMQALNQI